MVVDDGAMDRFWNSAELDVKLAVPEATEAPVIAKPAGAEICTEPSCWVDASFVTLNAKEGLAPAAGFDGETVTAKHLPDGGAQDVCPTAGAASMATPSKLAVITKKEIRATINPAFDMAPLTWIEPIATCGRRTPLFRRVRPRTRTCRPGIVWTVLCVFVLL